MSSAPELTAVAELAIQFTGFRNIDLFSQGIYQIRVTATGAHSGMSAVPFAFVTVPPPEQGSLPSSLINVDHLLPPLIFDDRGEFSSSAFRIKYCDEEVRTQHQSVRARLLQKGDAATDCAVPWSAPRNDHHSAPPPSVLRSSCA